MPVVWTSTSGVFADLNLNCTCTRVHADLPELLEHESGCIGDLIQYYDSAKHDPWMKSGPCYVSPNSCAGDVMVLVAGGLLPLVLRPQGAKYTYVGFAQSGVDMSDCDVVEMLAERRFWSMVYEECYDKSPLQEFEVI